MAAKIKSCHSGHFRHQTGRTKGAAGSSFGGRLKERMARPVRKCFPQPDLLSVCVNVSGLRAMPSAKMDILAAPPPYHTDLSSALGFRAACQAILLPPPANIHDRPAVITARRSNCVHGTTAYAASKGRLRRHACSTPLIFAQPNTFTILPNRIDVYRCCGDRLYEVNA